MPDLGGFLVPDHLEKKLALTLEKSVETMAAVTEALEELDRRVERLELRTTAVLTTVDALLRSLQDPVTRSATVLGKIERLVDAVSTAGWRDG
jgi:hypothetical protein